MVRPGWGRVTKRILRGNWGGGCQGVYRRPSATILDSAEGDESQKDDEVPGGRVLFSSSRVVRERSGRGRPRVHWAGNKIGGMIRESK